MSKFFLILADGFEEIEALATTDILKRIGHQVTLCGLKSLEVCGTHDIRVKCDCLLAEIKQDDYDGVILPGGLPGAQHLYSSGEVVKCVGGFDGQGKIVAAICAAPIVLFKAGLLANGRTFTMYPGFEKVMPGVKPTGRLTERSGNLVTGKGPGASAEFAYRIALTAGTPAEEAAKVFESMFIPVPVIE